MLERSLCVHCKWTGMEILNFKILSLEACKTSKVKSVRCDRSRWFTIYHNLHQAPDGNSCRYKKLAGEVRLNLRCALCDPIVENGLPAPLWKTYGIGEAHSPVISCECKQSISWWNTRMYVYIYIILYIIYICIYIYIILQYLLDIRGKYM